VSHFVVQPERNLPSHLPDLVMALGIALVLSIDLVEQKARNAPPRRR
jgi:hypothetical protein